MPLQGEQERYQVLLFLRRELGAEDQVEELDRVFEGQQPPVVHGSLGRPRPGSASLNGDLPSG